MHAASEYEGYVNFPEEKAHAFFVAALPALADPEVRALFEELRDEEVHHQALISEQMVGLPPDPDAPPTPPRRTSPMNPSPTSAGHPGAHVDFSRAPFLVIWETTRACGLKEER